MSQYAAAIDKIIADNPHVKAGDPHMPPCTPARKTPLTGANLPEAPAYSYRSAEPDTILFDDDCYAYKADEPVRRAVPTDWPAGAMKVKRLVEV